MKKLNQFFAFYSLPVLVVFVASWQLYKTETTALSRWKGGGFGMYTNINEGSNIIVINDSIFKDEDFINIENRHKHKAKNNFLFNPSNSTVNSFLNTIKQKEKVKKIQIYQPVLNPKNNTLTYQLYYEKIVE
ncbi:MAG: hypothetical protein LAT51_04500 [Flavobacteriaceae bacterium]|nr:hypothetical protein [Flavobacteriaceae bacterium]